MSIDSDQHLNEFRLKSDKAFLEMQARADRAMETFVKQYSDSTVAISSFQTPQMAWGVTPPVILQVNAAPVRKKARKAAEAAGNAVGKAVRKVRDAAAGHTGHSAYNDFGELGEALQKDLKATAHEAVDDTQGWLRHASMDLGERAKREAAAMREAARKAMAEETSLRGLKERAQRELAAAKERMKNELQEAGAHAMQDLEALAVDAIGDVGEHGIAAAEAAQRRASAEFDELLGG